MVLYHILDPCCHIHYFVNLNNIDFIKTTMHLFKKPVTLFSILINLLVSMNSTIFRKITSSCALKSKTVLYIDKNMSILSPLTLLSYSVCSNTHAMKIISSGLYFCASIFGIAFILSWIATTIDSDVQLSFNEFLNWIVSIALRSKFIYYLE